MEKEELIQKILQKKKEKNAVIMAHNYQIEPVQLISDYLGDSLGLARESAETEADLVVLAGVNFMAETAAMLNPDKKILLPSKEAECPMASMLPPEKVREAKKSHPEAVAVVYVNTLAETRAEADVTCTSSNAVDIVKRLDEDEVIFGPDQNLAWHVEQNTDKDIITVPNDGHCYVHREFSLEDLARLKEKNPNAVSLVHPESNPEVQKKADYLCSTGQMFDKVRESGSEKFIIGTEIGIINRLKREFPNKEFLPLLDDAICEGMKKHSLKKIYESLKDEKYEVDIEPEVAERAKKSTERMLELSD